MYCCSGSDWLEIWADCHAAFIPTGNAILVKRNMATKGNNLLPVSVDGILNVDVFLAMPRRVG